MLMFASVAGPGLRLVFIVVACSPGSSTGTATRAGLEVWAWSLGCGGHRGVIRFGTMFCYIYSSTWDKAASIRCVTNYGIFFSIAATFLRAASASDLAWYTWYRQ